MPHPEALETTKMYSTLGLAHGLIDTRPFRARHTISIAAVIGGGSSLLPGEISLDERPEFARSAVGGLLQPLEARSSVIDRVHGALRLPASFLLVATANPRPCGRLDSRVRGCTCGLA